MSSLIFKHPEPSRPKTRIWPIFMPFMGCPSRCVYCSQEKQTGSTAKALNQIYQNFKDDIPAFFADSNRQPLEVAFFGGTFTALPMEWQVRFVSLAQQFKDEGLITKVRCSTRPDCISYDHLMMLKDSGLDMVELGIQSFSARTLKRSARNYSPETARMACETVKRAGLSLGIQLLPGLPGSTRGNFLRDVSETIELRPDAVRVYPCLTVKGTALEKLFNAGKYHPWSLSRTEEELSFALLRFWNHKIQVIRLGVASEEGFEENIVAGPVHPALGQLIRSKALYLFIRSRLPLIDSKITRVTVPSKYSGEFWGHKGVLKNLYSCVNITPEIVRFSKGRQFELHS
ncbi:elongator complex protein 3 [Maridesulfovibrio frigidus]|uniref:elongator complex protein 3 n=1 Tax=Maridesulfovibrio frigidus TaxID=340956 RepID=UPI0004E239DB|nr:radical SAM protein [Maridesulfovibrio frigidus]